MPGLPVLSAHQVVRAFQRAGWEVARQQGSHIIMTRSDTAVTLSVPDHSEVKRGTLRSLIRKAGLTVQEFQAIVR